MSNINLVTVDGPSGSGKGTVCHIIAARLKWNLLDSGALYRILAFAALQKKISLDDQKSLANLALNLNVSFQSNGVGVDTLLAGENVGDKLRTETVAQAASQVASLQLVRDALLTRQKAFYKEPGLIADGRDMGTVVFPDAPVKIFLDASAEQRALRRFNQLQSKGFNVSLAEILSEIKERDFRDRNRPVAPLKPAEDALVIDSTSLTVVQVVDQIFELMKLKLKLIVE
ncbi:cytidylate kinase [Psychromonas ingrahamii 37]|uniref:Cytidylate kinase n=1 Tax=Psychromonas ingrahamii (strain DSM 17664 / CCUG 51855 / 37) TaxID=357804 RepID=A1SZ01_PSYIN|nr:(d)CMP kinase [Psychromonas ingrahamii]ABM04716.1 cytidylate kinase [Psychromonas ingrahamii 37]